MLLIFGQSGQQDEDMVMMKFIVLGTKFKLRLRTPRSLYQMAISVRCHTGRDVITKSNEIESKDQWYQVQRFAGGLLPQIWLTFHTLNMNTLDVEEKHFIFITNLYRIKLYHNCGLSF